MANSSGVFGVFSGVGVSGKSDVIDVPIELDVLSGIEDSVKVSNSDVDIDAGSFEELKDVIVEERVVF